MDGGVRSSLPSRVLPASSSGQTQGRPVEAAWFPPVAHWDKVRSLGSSSTRGLFQAE